MTKSKNALDGSDQEQYSAEQSETNLTRAHRNTCWPSAQLIDVPGRDVKHRSELSFSSLMTHQVIRSKRSTGRSPTGLQGKSTTPLFRRSRAHGCGSQLSIELSKHGFII